MKNKIQKYNNGDSRQRFQGDVSIITLKSAPKGLTFKKVKSFVAAEGEVTGHMHTVKAHPGSIIEIAEDKNGFYLNVVKGSAEMTHQEHDVHIIQPGIHFIGRQMEYDPVEQYRRVQD